MKKTYVKEAECAKFIMHIIINIKVEHEICAKFIMRIIININVEHQMLMLNRRTTITDGRYC